MKKSLNALLVFAFVAVLAASLCLITPQTATAENAEECQKFEAQNITEDEGTSKELMQLAFWGKKKNPCEKNPCARNPCAKNPCAKNPCASKNTPIRKKQVTDQKKLLTYGKALWNDEKLGKVKGTSCSTCHPGGALLNSKPYPRHIKMAGDILTLDQMINFCMINPMKAKPLKWNSN